MTTESIALGSHDGSKCTIADEKGKTQSVASAGWQDTTEVKQKHGGKKS